MNLVDQLTEVREQLAQLDNNNRDHLADISKLKAQETELTNQIALEEAEQQRILVQEEKVESISLPYDFSEVFDDPRANEMIIELLKDMRRQDFAEHNQEVSELVAAHREELNEEKTKREEIYAQLGNTSRLFSELENAHNNVVSDNVTYVSKISILELAVEDITYERNAAVAKAEGLELLVSEKQAQIDKLRDEIAIGAVAAVHVVNIDPSDKLARLIEESKQAKVKSALDIALENTAPFRGKVITEGQVVAQLNAPEAAVFQVVDQTGNPISGMDTAEPVGVPTDNQEVAFRPEEGEVHSESSGLGQGNAEEVGESGRTLEEAFKRIEALEAKLGA